MKIKPPILSILIIPIIVLASCTQQVSTSDKTQELTIFGMFNSMIFDETWPVFKKAQELTGISLKSKISQNATVEKEAFNLMVASGDLPDIIRFGIPATLNVLGIDGGLIPLQDLVDKHAPNIKKFWEENPDLKRIVTAYDGNIYQIPYYPPKGVPGAVHIIRKDWLDKLGLPAPVTIDDLYNTLKAFKTQDPNGNGLADEIPLFQRSADIPNTLRILFDFFQLSYMWRITETEGVSFDPALPKFRDAVRTLSQWYAEGLIDPEIFTRNIATTRDYMFGNNLGGYTFDWASTAYYVNSLKDTIPGFNLTVLLPPQINNQRVTSLPRTTFAGGWGISFSSKDPITVIKYFDFWFSEEGRRLWNYGIEGNHYTMVDGKPIFTDKILKASSPLNELYKVGAQWEIGMSQDYEYEKQISHPIIKEGYQLYIDNDAVLNIINYAILQHNSEVTREFNMINAQLESYTLEMIQKWLLGASDVDQDWDAYLKHLEKLDLQRATEINQQGLQRYLS